MYHDPYLPFVIRRIIVAIGSVGFSLIISLVIIKLFRVKNPSIRYALLFIPLIKGLMAITRQTVSVAGNQRAAIFIVFKLSNPKFFPSAPFDIDKYHEAYFVNSHNGWYLIPTLLLIILLLVLLFRRLYQLFRFNNLLSKAVEVDPNDSLLYPVLNKLADEAEINRPKLIVVATRAAPFTVGIIKPLIVLSPTLINNLSFQDMKAVLAHEVAHIARRDYLYHWLVVILRDVMFFNPLTFFIYKLLNFEKEKACDYFGAVLIKDRLSLASGLVSVAELRLAEPEQSYIKSFAPQNFLKKKDSEFSYRVKELIEPTPLRKLNSLQTVLILSIFIFLLVFDIHIGTFLIKPFLLLT